MSVYIDPRKAKKIEETPAPAETVEEWTDKIKAMDNETVGRKVAAALGALFISPLVFMFFWNWIMVGTFGLPVLGYLKSFGLLVMARLIFKHD